MPRGMFRHAGQVQRLGVSHMVNGQGSCPSSRPTAAALALLAGLGLACSSVLVSAQPARADDREVFLQWFETSWTNIEKRMPDAFVTGYNAFWLPPIWKASFSSAGYDIFDRFDLGQPGSETTFGTESYFRAMMGETQRANIGVYPDLIMNHNGARTNNAQFLADGGWPGFYLPNTGGDPWGDFHNGTTQSQQPNPQGGDQPYNLWEGDLVSLIDIAQEKNYQYVRHPVSSTPPVGAVNLPAGLVRNKPDPNNARFYPDRQLTPLTFTNPIDGANWTVYPFNTTTPLNGDAYAENATGLLMRSTQWMLDEFKVAGFRLDAAKHIPQWFWNSFYDPIVFNRVVTPTGTRRTPYSFGESVAGNDFVQTYIRNKDGFGNRDALDLNGAGQLRDIRSQRGFGSWLNALNAAIDTQDDGNNNGSQGVRHVYSHDNGSTGGGGSAPGVPGLELAALPQNAFVLLAAGKPIVYYNGREMHDRFQSRGFWPREGNPTALGNDNPHLQRLVQIAQGYVRHDNANIPGAMKNYFYVLNSTDPQNASLNDVLVFERSNYNAADTTRNDIGTEAAASLLVGLSDSYSTGVQQRSVQTSFPPGTRLRELTGAWSDSTVNATGQIPQVLVVDANRRVLLTIPNNASLVSGQPVEHHRGYVVYGPAAPSGTLSLVGSTATIPADPPSVPTYQRRLTPMDVITTPTFEIRLDTTKTDPNDPNWDDFAVFRIDGGYVDYNGNGNFDQSASLALDGGMEQFLTQKSSISGPGGTGTTGVYRQTINSSQLSEGTHYLSVFAYRRRTDGGAPILTDFRKVFYVDRLPPQVTLQPNVIAAGGGTFQYRVTTTDRTVNAVHIIANVPNGTDPLTLVNSGNRAFQYDRFEWRLASGSLPPGTNQITVVAYELSGRSSVQTVPITIDLGSGDVNRDGLVNIDDLYASWLLTGYQAEADLNRNGLWDPVTDRVQLELLLRQQEVQRMEGLQR